MKLNSFRTTLLTAMSAVLICGAPVLSLAQCVPGSGVNQAQLSSQNWTPRLTADLNSIRFNAGSYNETLYPMGNIISIAPDEDNFALLDQRGLVWQVSSKVESGALGANRFYQPAGSNVQPQAGAIAGGTQFESDARLINAGGVMWVARPSAKGLVPLVACSLNTTGVTSACKPNPVYNAPLTVGFAISAGTFDGSNYWFTTREGALLKVIPGATASTAPSVIKFAVGKGGLGDVVFDGRYLWIASARNATPQLYQFDPVTNTSVANFPITGQITALTYDGTFLWVTSSGVSNQFDPVQGKVVRQLSTQASLTLVNGSTIDGFSSQAVSYRACDLAPLRNRALPGTATGAALADGRYAVIYGNNTVSLR